jgi:hypothetical protein
VRFKRRATNPRRPPRAIPVRSNRLQARANRNHKPSRAVVRCKSRVRMSRVRRLAFKASASRTPHRKPIYPRVTFRTPRVTATPISRVKYRCKRPSPCCHLRFQPSAPRASSHPRVSRRSCRVLVMSRVSCHPVGIKRCQLLVRRPRVARLGLCRHLEPSITPRVR